MKRTATKCKMLVNHQFVDVINGQGKRKKLKAGDIYEGEKLGRFVSMGIAEFVFDEPKAEKREKKVVKPTEKKAPKKPRTKKAKKEE